MRYLCEIASFITLHDGDFLRRQAVEGVNALVDLALCHMVRRLGKGSHFHLAVVQSGFTDNLLQAAGCCVIDPLFSALRAEGGTHPADYYDSAAQVRGECRGAFCFISAAERAGGIGRVHGFRLVR